MDESHGAGHAHGPGASAIEDPAAFWEDRYSSSGGRIWSGRPNAVLVDVVGPLTPGRALDLGCGEGGDAVWLAAAGWDVTAVDISATALDRAAAHAAEAGVADRVRTERHELGRSFPAGRFELVSAQFFQSPVALPRAQVLRTAAAALVPGGLLLVVDHGEAPPWSEHAHDGTHFPPPEEVLAELDLDPAAWATELLEQRERPATAPDGSPGTLVDNVLALRRRGA